jgi:hypothetical protein
VFLTLFLASKIMVDKKQQSLEFQIRFRIPQRFPSVIASEMVIQPSSDGVLLSFFEIIPPLVSSDTTPEQIEAMKQAGVVAECVSRVFVPKSKFAAFAKAMSDVLPNTQETKKSKGK